MRAFLGKDSPYRESFAEGLSDPWLSAMPPEARRTVLAAGIEPLVARALREAATAGPEPTTAFLATRQELGMRLISLETQLSAMLFEAECTGELIESMTFELDRRERSRELALAIASLAVGSVAAVGAGVWDLAQEDSIGPAVLGLAGGAGSAALAGAAFVPRTQHMRFRHPHNLLTPMVTGSDEGELYPRFVFRMLTLPGADGGASPRESVLLQWQDLIDEAVSENERAHAATLLYGVGGVYDQNLMSLRERLYDVLETKLNALARDLELLDRYLVRALERPESIP